MNIFYLHPDPVKAAEYHYNRHVVKMRLEAAQMLCTAHHVIGEDYEYDTSYVPYKKAHVNHPSTIWVRSGLDNYNWTYQYMMALGDEYTNRYGRTHLTIEKCRDVLYMPPLYIDNTGFTQPPQCMPDEYKVEGHSCKAYWNYYINDKKQVTIKNEQPHLQTPSFL